MIAEQYSGKTFANLSSSEIIGILNTAMDNDDWHTPSANDLSIIEQTERCIYGYFNCSLHNQYHDQERYFNINSDTIQIWIRKYDRGRADICLYKIIHNIIKLGAIIDILSKNSKNETNNLR